jgi:uncharacterized protein (TIGR03663 family)
MRRKTTFSILLLSAVLAAGVVFRLHHLRHRPMHTDEAIHAFQFGTLLEEGVFKYDPLEYHGPSLIVFSAIPAWIRGEKTLARTDETAFRIVPVFFGLALIPLLLFLVRGLGMPSVLAAAFWTAVSAPLIFYSRYFIHETLLVFFSFCALVFGYRYLRAKTWTWASLFGVSIGLMHATKETCILAWGTAVAALALVRLYALIRKDGPAVPGGKITFNHLIIAGAAAAGVSMLLFSSFFRRPEGIVDSIKAFFVYFKRSHVPSVHDHPWYYYFRLLAFYQTPGKSVWTEIPILVLACIGGISVFKNRVSEAMDNELARFLVFYTVILFVVYSAIPYKTPWCALGFYHGLALLAGLGTVALWQSARTRFQKTAAGIFLTLLCVVAARQSILLNGRYDSDQENPWVYAQTLPDVFQIVRSVEKAVDAAPDRYRTPVEVIMPGHGYWPLPWYFRKLKNVGWYDRVPKDLPLAPIVIIAVEQEPDLVRMLYEKPPPGERTLRMRLWKERLFLRPGVEVRGYVKSEE